MSWKCHRQEGLKVPNLLQECSVQNDKTKALGYACRQYLNKVATLSWKKMSFLAGRAESVNYVARKLQLCLKDIFMNGGAESVDFVARILSPKC